jgi:hypothetical protein
MADLSPRDAGFARQQVFSDAFDGFTDLDEPHPNRIENQTVR